MYNGERFLPFALDSILEQTHTNLEVIIFDNASTDSTEAIARAYAAKDKRVSYFRNATNLGAARNYNLTVEHANGKYFKWSAHDDICKPTFVERCVELLEREPKVSLAYPKTSIIGDDGALRNTMEDGFDFRESQPHIRWRRFCEAPLDCNAVFGVMRLDLLRKTPCIGGYEASDRVLLGEFALMGEIAEIPERLFLRRYHDRISTHAHATKKSMAAWFDPKSKGRFTRTKRFIEYLKVIQRARLNVFHRTYCLYHLTVFYLQPQRWVRLFKGLFVASIKKDMRTAGNQI